MAYSHWLQEEEQEEEQEKEEKHEKHEKQKKYGEAEGGVRKGGGARKL